MADQKPTPVNPEKNPGPIENPKVTVKVQPTKPAPAQVGPAKQGEFAPAPPVTVKKPLIEKIQENVTKEVHKALEKGKDGGAPAQIQRAKEKVEEVQKELKQDGKNVKIDVEVNGNTKGGGKINEKFSSGEEPANPSRPKR